jgi:hypothetical protein
MQIQELMFLSRINSYFLVLRIQADRLVTREELQISPSHLPQFLVLLVLDAGMMAELAKSKMIKWRT